MTFNTTDVLLMLDTCAGSAERQAKIYSRGQPRVSAAWTAPLTPALRRHRATGVGAGVESALVLATVVFTGLWCLLSHPPD